MPSGPTTAATVPGAMRRTPSQEVATQPSSPSTQNTARSAPKAGPGEVAIDVRGNTIPAVVVPYHLRGDAPPFFFLYAYNDPVSASSPSLFLAFKAANKPAELHTFAAGGHGFGMPNHGQPSDGWIERFGDWLRYQKLMK